MRQSGFTLVELMIVVAILMIMVMIMGAFSTVSTGRGELLDASTQVKDTIRRAQWQSMHGKDDDGWSVHLDTTEIVLFKGVIYSVGHVDNYQIAFPDTVQISNISLTGGGTDVIFDDEFGNTSTDGTITLINTITGDTRVVTINTVGLIDLD